MATPLADLRELYTSRGDLTHRDSSQRTLLLRAAQRGQVDLVKYFLSLGMNTEAVNNCHQTSLFIACYNGNFAIVSTLLEHGADPNVRDRFKRSCLGLSCKLGFDRIVRLLLVYGARYKLVPEQNQDVKRYGTLVGLLRYHRAAKRIKQMYINYQCRRAFVDLYVQIYYPGHCGAKRVANHFNALALECQHGRCPDVS